MYKRNDDNMVDMQLEENGTIEKFKAHVLDKFLSQSKGIGLDSGEKDYDFSLEFKQHLLLEYKKKVDPSYT